MTPAFKQNGCKVAKPSKAICLSDQASVLVQVNKVLGLSSWREVESEILTLVLLFTSTCPYKVQGSKK